MAAYSCERFGGDFGVVRCLFFIFSFFFVFLFFRYLRLVVFVCFLSFFFLFVLFCFIRSLLHEVLGLFIGLLSRSIREERVAVVRGRREEGEEKKGRK